MNGLATFSERLRDNLFRAAHIPAAIALIVVIVAFVFSEQQSQLVHRQSLRTEVLNEVSLIRSRLEGNVNANIQLVRGLVSVIATEPAIEQERFADLAANLFTGTHQMRSVAAAPDLVVRMAYPVEGNEGSFGLNYMENDAQREAALRARDTGELVVAGPVNLVQGGVGFIGRFPVHYRPMPGVTRFWGLVSTVIDADKLYEASGLNSLEHLNIAIAGKDATGADGPVFFGDEKVFLNDPVLATVSLPTGSWQIAAAPAAGWEGMPDNIWTIRFFIIAAGLLLLAPIFVLGQMFDERLRTRRQLQIVSRRLELALRSSDIGVWESVISTGELYWDQRMRRLYDAPLDAPVNFDNWADRLHPEDAMRARSEFEFSVQQLRPYQSNYRIILSDGRVRHIRAMGAFSQDLEGRNRIVGVNWDVTADVKLNADLRQAKSQAEARNSELEDAKADIEQMALHDALTGLPNRRSLDDYLSNLGSHAKGEFGLLHIDLDRFKQINDTLGHAAGDATLVHTANVLRTHVRDDDFVARIGGDEFVVVCSKECTEPGMELLAERIVSTMREPLIYEGRACRSGVSIGVAMSSTSDNDPRQALINADIALYRAKNHGRNTHQLFSHELHIAAVHTKHMADEILSGLDDDQFVAHYQGQFDARTHALTGVEALARWNHPEKGVLPPSVFLPIAEDLNVLASIDARILDQALHQMKNWRRSGIDVPNVAVNVSARRLHDPDLMQHLETLQFEPGSLTFELVESTFLDQHDDQVAWNLDRIREMGIALEIDDFGTGYASIVSLMQLRPNRLKIDRQLVVPTADSAAQRDLVRSIVDIGKSLNIESLAEGVETMRHAEVMQELGCTVLQGFAFAKPMSGRAFSRFARSHAANLGKRQKGVA